MSLSGFRAFCTFSLSCIYPREATRDLMALSFLSQLEVESFIGRDIKPETVAVMAEKLENW